MKAESPKSEPMLRVHWFVSPTHNVPITCSLVVGLQQLSRLGEVELKLSRLEGHPGSRNTLRLDLTDLTGDSTRRVCFDYSDRSDLFCHKTLESVDVYFKRNYWRDSTNELPGALRARVKPAGITFGCYVPGSRRVLSKSAILSFLGRFQARGKFRFRKSLKRLFSDLEQIRCFLQDSEWERTASDVVLPRAVFQTRVWQGNSRPKPDRIEVNENRISLTRALREEFGFAETVGLLDTQCSRKLAPDAVLARKVSRTEYARQLRTSLIAVNSQGLDGSIGFKVAEALAAGCALVSEPLRVQLAVPLEADVHYLPFDTPEQCVNQCRYLLDNPDVAEEMRARNLDYYKKYVRPLSLARELLSRAFESDTLDNGEQPRLDKTACGID